MDSGEAGRAVGVPADGWELRLKRGRRVVRNVSRMNGVVTMGGAGCTMVTVIYEHILALHMLHRTVCCAKFTTRHGQLKRHSRQRELPRVRNTAHFRGPAASTQLPLLRIEQVFLPLLALDFVKLEAQGEDCTRLYRLTRRRARSFG